MLTVKKDISPFQFGLFRILFGVYLFQHFALLFPYAEELYSRNGVLSPTASPTFAIFPSPFWFSDSPAAARSVVALGAGASLLFTLGLARRTCATLVWLAWAWLFNRNVLTSNPSLPYVGLILVLTVLVPRGESLGIGRRPAEPWFFPGLVYWCAWGLMAIGYTFSGVVKFSSPSWIDGTALYHLLHNPLARPGLLRDVFLQAPSVLSVLTWTALAAEVLFLPLSVFRKGRMVAWTMTVVLHVGILCFVSFADLTVGMLMIHLFTFDPEWFPPRSGNSQRILFFDGACGFCNHSVRSVMTLDRAALISAAPLQGNTAAEVLPRHLRDPAKLATMVYAVRGQNEAWTLYVRSTAVLTMLGDVGGIGRILSWLQVVPRPLRDAVYSVVAHYRSHLSRSGAGEVCGLPAEKDRRRLLP